VIGGVILISSGIGAATATAAVPTTAAVPATTNTTQDIVALALLNDATHTNLGIGGCRENSAGGIGYYTSCHGNGGQPEFWCSDFAHWIWAEEGVQDTGMLTADSATFVSYGEKYHTWSKTPAIGDAVVFGSPTYGPDQHVAIVSQVNSNGTIETISGDWGGDPGDEATFASTSNVDVNAPAYDSAVGSTSAIMGYYIQGYAAPVGVTATVTGGSAQASQAAAQASDTVDVLYQENTSDNGLGHVWYSKNSGWNAPVDMAGGPLNSEPSVVTSKPGTVDAFWEGTGPGYDLWHRYYSTSAGTWSPPVNLGLGPLGGPPEAVAQSNGTIDVFWRGQGPGYNLWHAWYTSKGGWTAKPQNLGGDLASNPSPVESSAGTVDVFWKDGSTTDGNNGGLSHAYVFQGGSWSQPQNLGMGPIGDPHATGQLDGTIDVFWKGASDDHLWHAWYTKDAGWTTKTADLAPNNTLASDPFAVSSSPGTVDVFWKGADGNLWHVYYYAGGGWSGATNLSMGPLGSDLFASAEYSGTVDVFWKGASDNCLWHAWYVSGSGWNTAPQNLTPNACNVS